MRDNFLVTSEVRNTAGVAPLPVLQLFRKCYILYMYWRQYIFYENGAVYYVAANQIGCRSSTGIWCKESSIESRAMKTKKAQSGNVSCIFLAAEWKFEIKMRWAWKNVKVNAQSEISEHVVGLKVMLWRTCKLIKREKKVDIKYISRRNIITQRNNGNNVPANVYTLWPTKNVWSQSDKLYV
jgi:hypothetical protein